VRHLLVTVQDITARMELEAKLMDERQRSQKEFSMLLRAFDADPAMLRQFVARPKAPAGSQ
jgi:two-component system chemotaxis sensor kinase CheA